MIEYQHSLWEERFIGEVGVADCVICDPEYDSPDLSYLTHAQEWLRPGGALWVFGDASSIAPVKIRLDEEKMDFQNWIIWPNDWGGRSKRRFGQKHDDILYYTKKGAPWTFNAEAVAVPKTMTMAAFNPSGRKDKIPHSVWNDLEGFSTLAKERVRAENKGIRWQKPEKIIRRMLLATTNEGDLVFDPFSGVATVPALCKALKRDCIATECDLEVFKAGRKRLSGV